MITIARMVVMMLSILNLMGHLALADVKPSSISFSNGKDGIGFDDLVFAPQLGQVIVPGGQTGKIYMIDPSTLNLTSIGGFSTQNSYAGGHAEGATSADAGVGLIFAIDQTTKTVHAINPSAGKIIDSSALLADPDYVRFVPSVGEVWVTEPDAEQIEVFSIKPLKSLTTISIPGGPESLIICIRWRTPIYGREKRLSSTLKLTHP